MLIRDAMEADIPALAQLHVTAWNQTYPNTHSTPTTALREQQWRDTFARRDDSWFALVVEDSGRLIGFAKGQHYNEPDLPQFSGELNKLYLLREHHGRGFGRRLIAEVARRFLGEGITSMVLFSEPSNPIGRFFEAMGGEKIFAKNGEFHGAYGWRDLNHLASIDLGRLDPP
jgi:L-amino acid N-acyltransferase YncA